MYPHDTHLYVARFHRVVQIQPGPDACWPCFRGPTDRGYSTLFRSNGKAIYTHRFAWELASGKRIPDGFVIGHTCDYPPCCRNDEEGVYEVNGVEYPRWGHLFCGPEIANVHDRDAKGRGVRGRPRSGPGNSPNGKLTNMAVSLIRTRFAAGASTQRALADEYGVSRGTISRIVNGHIWKHAPHPTLLGRCAGPR